jgi:hypothetical protein
MANEQPNPSITAATEPGRKAEQDSHAAGAGSSTGDPGNARGKPGSQGVPSGKPHSTGPAADDGAIPID